MAETQTLETSEQEINRWMVSYADFVTLLFVTFVALYFVLLQKQAGEEKSEAAKPVTEQVQWLEVAAMQNMQRRIEQELRPLLDSGIIRLAPLRDELRIDIGEQVLFEPGQAELQAQAMQALQPIAQALSRSSVQIQVEGHTDSSPIQTARYPSNWELSAARASAVARFLQASGIDPKRLSAVGLADTRNLADNTTEKGKALNRRVSLVVKL